MGRHSYLEITLLLLVCLSIPICQSLNNGLALTPPMGWLSWQRFRCNTDCVNDPENCISEQLIKRQSDCLVSEGYRDHGYEYVTIDDCWSATERDKDGKLQPDPDRFPNGIKKLSDYVHSKGLKFGIYGDFGSKTCAGYPGSEYHMKLDAQTFADWEVDLLKFDGCNSDIKDAPKGYPAMTKYLNMTGRPILYSCEWPFYNWQHGIKSNFTAIRNTCNMWRNHWDIQDSWQSVTGVIQYFVKNDKQFRSFAGPGGWNDPDMLVIGNYGLSYDEERAQMAMWAILASPLIMSLDACNVRPRSKSILQNKNVIAVNQDKLGIQGSLKLVQESVYKLQIWTRPITPHGSYAIVILNLRKGGGPSAVNFTLTDLDIYNSDGYNLTETFDGKYLGIYKSNATFKCKVNPSGVYMITAVPVTYVDNKLRFVPRNESISSEKRQNDRI
ncbi:alpha-N-acetylgalactosaminidase-like [Mercenaria mercenaria]|uniref:alpha-N-acetylgalactosaminidase-like n=1 Tax=Mercenaria mercenaria TaxID=6596 RepID=UPI00234F0877|nr:alpha-N-acetylgalactosaminidase-like [Mercenaria mercenaria]